MIVPRMGTAGFWCGFIIASDLRRHHDDAADAFLQRQPSSIILQRAARYACLSPPLRRAFSFFAITARCTFRYSLTPKTLTDSLPAGAYSVANSPAVGLLKKPSRGFQNEKSISSGRCRCYGSVISCFRCRCGKHHPECSSQPYVPFTIRNITKRPRNRQPSRKRRRRRNTTKLLQNRLLSKKPRRRRNTIKPLLNRQ